MVTLTLVTLHSRLLVTFQHKRKTWKAGNDNFETKHTAKCFQHQVHKNFMQPNFVLFFTQQSLISLVILSWSSPSVKNVGGLME